MEIAVIVRAVKARLSYLPGYRQKTPQNFLASDTIECVKETPGLVVGQFYQIEKIVRDPMVVKIVGTDIWGVKLCGVDNWFHHSSFRLARKAR